MATKLNPISIRLGRFAYWKNKNFYSVITYNTSSQYYFEFFILRYFAGLANVFAINRRGQWAGSVISSGNEMSFISPLVNGASSVFFRFDRVVIKFRYYFDLKNNFKSRYFQFRFKLMAAVKSLSKILGLRVVLHELNYYVWAIKPVRQADKGSSLVESGKRAGEVNVQMFSGSEAARLSFYYHKIVVHVRRFLKNQYFYRVFNVFFSSFVGRRVDLELIVNAITSEIRRLRKQHNKFVMYVSKLLRSLFLVFGKSLKLAGIMLIFQGRLIPFNREYPRTVKKVSRIGEVYAQTLQVWVSKFVSSVSARFGAINVALTVAYLPVFIKPTGFVDILCRYKLDGNSLLKGHNKVPGLINFLFFRSLNFINFFSNFWFFPDWGGITVNWQSLKNGFKFWFPSLKRWVLMGQAFKRDGFFLNMYLMAFFILFIRFFFGMRVVLVRIIFAFLLFVNFCKQLRGVYRPVLLFFVISWVITSLLKSFTSQINQFFVAGEIRVTDYLFYKVPLKFSQFSFFNWPAVQSRRIFLSLSEEVNPTVKLLIMVIFFIKKYFWGSISFLGTWVPFILEFELICKKLLMSEVTNKFVPQTRSLSSNLSHICSIKKNTNHGNPHQVNHYSMKRGPLLTPSSAITDYTASLLAEQYSGCVPRSLKKYQRIFVKPLKTAKPHKNLHSK